MVTRDGWIKRLGEVKDPSATRVREGDAATTRYEQMVTVPDTVDAEKIAATFRHGLLELTLPLKDVVKPRRIEISTEAQQQLSPAA